MSWFKRRPKREAAPPQDASDPWTIATTEEEGQTVVLRFRSQIPAGIDVGAYPHLVNIYWRSDGGDGSGGMPPSETLDRMGELELLLEPLEGPGLGFLVLVVTGNGRREWIWYVREVPPFLMELNVALQGQDKPFPIEIETNPDPTWAAYTTLLPPSAH